MRPKSAGYSGTPLARKLGIAEGSRVHARGAPSDYSSLLEPLPLGVEFMGRVTELTDIVHIFCDQRAELGAVLSELRASIRSGAAVWVSWPKKSSKRATDITEDRIRDLALPMGFVDIKVCSVSETWSALKLVIRKELRA
jgi:Protein of unknown function (DUF3052)